MSGSSKIAVILTPLFGVMLLLVAGVPATSAAPLVSAVESNCARAIGKGSSRLAYNYARQVSGCRNKDISGSTIGACPNAKDQQSIDTRAAWLTDTVLETCKSTCSLSGLPCIADAYCPPAPNEVPPAAELCSAGAADRPFDFHKLGFPGAFCESVLGGPIIAGEDLATCVSEKTTDGGVALIEVIYGSITNASGVSAEAAMCLKNISRAAQKLSNTIYRGVIKCRGRILDGDVVANPATCTTDDASLAAKVARAEDRLEAAINACTDSDILELDLCLQGPGGVSDRTGAIECLIPAVRQITDTELAPIDRFYAPSTLVEAAYPPVPACGDGAANQIPSPFFLLGEECDLDDDSACPNNCIAPGDLFQCTCAGNERRIRFQADGFTADLDNGWSGTSHNSGVTDKAGFINTLSNCDCDSMTGATCTGTSSDSVCDVEGNQRPSCSWDPFGATRCESFGTDGNTTDDNADCFICDQFSLNSGDFCVNEGNCIGQCYPLAGGAPTGACPEGQIDCASGEICRGQCDRTPTCIIVPNGAPLPISSGGTPVCILTTFRDDIFGTQNVVTGSHALFIQQYSKVHLGVSTTAPCPQCGGFCSGGFLEGDPCHGTCSTTTTTECRFDEDCPSGETCTDSSPQCPGSSCNLSLVCRGGPNNAQPCRISANTTKFGTTSAECPPPPGQNISGAGLAINFWPQTSEVSTLPATLACEDGPYGANNDGFQNYDCECPGKTNVPALFSQPNKCGFACNAGAELGVGCGSGGGLISGNPTRCAGGSEPNAPCDEDADCSGGGTCSQNPKHCLGGPPSLERVPCSTNGDCGGGTCEDACPSGRCTPLCLPADHPLFPPGFGFRPDDPEEGLCAAGPPTYHCSSEEQDFRLCDKETANATCAATCSVSGNPCSPLSPCPPVEGTCEGPCEVAKVCEAGVDAILGTEDDFPGAGICVPDARNCFVQPLTAEGGDTGNGNGDPTNVRAVSTFCIAGTSNGAINTTAGLGGPGRLRQNGINITNGFNSLP